MGSQHIFGFSLRPTVQYLTALYCVPGSTVVYCTVQEWLLPNWLHGASVKAGSRAGIVDWLVEVGAQYNTLP